jgi:sulfide:quinone oxidoreductase
MRSRVLIAGGGVAAIEVALALRDLAGERVRVEICSPSHDFAYRPYAVGEPYGRASVAHYDLGQLAALCGARFHRDRIVAVDADAGVAVGYDGERYSYDHLVVAPGAERLWPLPGALTFWGIADGYELGKVVEGLRGGELESFAFTMPGADGWALPLYELALLAESEVSRAGLDVRLVVVTPEDAPLGVFGREVAEGMGELLAERGIEVIARTSPVRFEDGRLRVVPGDAVAVDAVVSLPKLEGCRIRGVPHDPGGFVRIDDRCRVIGRKRLFAAGDVTDFPVKQGGIATQQADVIAEAIAAEVGVDLEPRRFDPVLRAVLWTGEEPRYLQGPLGGHGAASSFTSKPPWGASEGKIVGRYLTSFIAGLDASGAAPAPGGP